MFLDLTKDVSETILAFYQKVSRLSIVTLLFLNLFVDFVTYVHVLFINKVYKISFSEAFLWLYIYPSIIFYILYALFAVIVFIIETSMFAYVRQKDILKKLNFLNSKLNKVENVSTEISIFIWGQFLNVNQTVIGFCEDIEQFSRYWTPYLTIYFAAQITLQVYFVYICFFVPGVNFLQTSFFLYGIFEIDLLLFLLINYCAKVVKANRRIELANANFYQRFMRLGIFKLAGFSKLILKVNVCVCLYLFILK